MAWNTVDLPGAQIATVDSAQVFPLGTKCTARNTSSGYVGEFVYMKGVASNSVGLFCQLDYDSGSVSLLADGAVGGVGVSMGSIVASTFGWFQVRGKGSGWLAASVADNAQLYINAGGVGQATASGKSEIMGARAAAASGSSAALTEVELSYPLCSILNQAA
jgi:hypothetical protein